MSSFLRFDAKAENGSGSYEPHRSETSKPFELRRLSPRDVFANLAINLEIDNQRCELLNINMESARIRARFKVQEGERRSITIEAENLKTDRVLRV